MLRRFLRPQNHICTAAERQRDMSVRCQTVSVRNSSVRIIEAPSGISQVTVVKTALVSEAPPVQAALGLALNSDTFLLANGTRCIQQLGITFQYYCVLQSLHKALPSTTVYYKKVCTKHFPVLLCTTKLAQSRSQYYCVLQSLYYKACTNTSQYYCVLQSLHKHVPVLLGTTKSLHKHAPVVLYTAKLAQSRSQYYCVLQSLHKHVPVRLFTTKLAQSTSQYYCVLQILYKHVPVLLRTTKLAQSTSQYYCVLQSLHKHVPVLLCTTKLAQSRPSTTVYYKACTNTSQYDGILQSLHKHVPVLLYILQSLHKQVPVLLCTTKLAQSRPSTTVYYKACTNTSQYDGILQSLHKHVPVLLYILQSLHKQVPVLLCTTKLAQSHSQYYCVLQSLHKHVPVVLYTTKLAQSRSQYYYVLQSLHNHVPVLLCTTKLAETHSSTRCCNFPHRHGDARGQAETEVFAASPIDTATCAQQNERGFAAFRIDTELMSRKTTRKKTQNVAPTNWRRTRQTPRL